MQTVKSYEHNITFSANITFEPATCKAHHLSQLYLQGQSNLRQLLAEPMLRLIFFLCGSAAILAKSRHPSPDKTKFQEMLRPRDITSLGQPSFYSFERSCASIHVGGTSVHPALEVLQRYETPSRRLRTRCRLWVDLESGVGLYLKQGLLQVRVLGLKLFQEAARLGQQLLQLLLFGNSNLISTSSSCLSSLSCLLLSSAFKVNSCDSLLGQELVWVTKVQ